jgi:quercetin dioxygenase-like cupin family protein
MSGQFVLANQAVREELDWGKLAWMSNPAVGARQLTVIEVILLPGKGHNFHKHPDQEEVIYVIEGVVEQWLEQNDQVLNPGDSVVISAGVVHASFNIGDKPAKLLAILGPCVGESGYELVDVADQAPWNTLRP